MGNLQTEIFTKVLPALRHPDINNVNFDDPEQPLAEPQAAQVAQGFNQTTEINVTKQVMEYIIAHPGCQVGDIAEHLGSTSNISTRVSQLRKRGFVRCSEERPMRLYHTGTAYATVSKKERTERMLAAAAQWRERKAKSRAKKKQDKRPTPVAPVAIEPTKSSKIDLNTLSIVEARHLYDELKKIFGG